MDKLTQEIAARWTPEAQAAAHERWRQEIIDCYGEGWLGLVSDAARAEYTEADEIEDAMKRGEDR
jgi:hypothetical protein